MNWQCHMGWPHIVREFFPGITDAQAWHILWTVGYPSFNAGDDSERVACCRSKLAQLVEPDNESMGCTHD